MLSAASKEFSTSSLTLVYKHLPGCSKKDGLQSLSFCQLAPSTPGNAPNFHVVKPGYVLVFRKELSRAFLLQNIRLAFCHEALLQQKQIKLQISDYFSL